MVKTRKDSSGTKKISRANTQIRRIKMKINRWKRYQQEIKDGKREGKSARWDTKGLEKHISLLEGLI